MRPSRISKSTARGILKRSSPKMKPKRGTIVSVRSADSRYTPVPAPLFKPEKEEDVKRLLDLQEDVHEGFKAYVRKRRLGKLKAEESELFTGAFWTGKRGLELGLIDGLGHMIEVLRRKFGEDVEIIEISAPKGWGLKRLGLGSATELPDAAFNALETRALYGRFGL